MKTIAVMQSWFRHVGRLAAGFRAGLMLLFILGCLVDATATPPSPPVLPESVFGPTPEYDYEPPEPGSYSLPIIKSAGDGRALDLRGDSQQLSELMADRITLLSFIYTRCADPTACPYATGVLHKIHRVSEQDSEIADNLSLVTFSFDPEHDTPQILESYTRALRKPTGSPWHFLTAAGREELQPLLESYGQRVDRRRDPEHTLGPYSHLLRVYLVDRQGRIRNIYSTGLLDPRLCLADVRTLLLEEP